MDKSNHTGGKKRRLPLANVILSWIVPLIFCGPALYLLVAKLIETGDGKYLALTLLALAFYLVLVYVGYLTDKYDAPVRRAEKEFRRAEGQEEELGSGTKIMLTALGASLIDKALEKEKPRAEDEDEPIL